MQDLHTVLIGDFEQAENVLTLLQGFDAYCIMVLIDTFEGTENSRTYATALVNRYASSPRSI